MATEGRTEGQKVEKEQQMEREEGESERQQYYM